MTWTIDGPQGNEAAKIRWDIVRYTRGRGLDLGCGPYKAFKHFIGVDNNADRELFGIQAKPDVMVESCEDLSVFASQSMDFVFSSHLLEHIENYQAALKEWYRVLKIGGYLILYLPDEDEYPKVGEDGANKDHKWDVSYDKVVDAMKPLGWDLVQFEKRNEGIEYSLFFVFKKANSKNRFSWKEEKPKKRAAVVRYGGIGDMIQASSVLPGLKEQGYHVTFFTTPVGKEILMHDPHIDDWVVQDTDQVPNHELPAFWDHHKKRFDKFINFSESVEGTFLALPGRTPHSWPHDVRHKYLNGNYLEFAHDLAGIPFVPRQKFYPSVEELSWVKRERSKLGGYVIMWSLSGSSVHKAWPWLDTVLARLMVAHPEVKVVLCGDTLCQMLEQGWENEPRVICRSGKWGIRESLAFAEQADLVVGTETGLLNAVGLSDVPKVITLSHSSEENLTKHWRNTSALTPVDTPCWPCHLMHYNFDHCFRDEETGCAKCQVNISADVMYDAIKYWIANGDERK